MIRAGRHPLCNRLLRKPLQKRVEPGALITFGKNDRSGRRRNISIKMLMYANSNAVPFAELNPREIGQRGAEIWLSISESEIGGQVPRRQDQSLSRRLF